MCISLTGQDSNMKLIWPVICILLVTAFMQEVRALNNPFKKTKTYHFGSDISWQQKGGAVVKSGKEVERGDTLSFHLSINNKQLKLRLSKNDPSGDIVNSRRLNNLVVKDVRVDGRRLPVFQWCLLNQEQPSSYLKQYAVVPGDVCVNMDGDLFVRMDNKTLSLLMRARQLTFVLEPFRREETVEFDMQGFNEIMRRLYPPAQPKPKARAVPKVVKSVSTPVVKSRAKPKASKICYAKAPAEFKKQVKPVSYPCDNKSRKSKAEASIAAQVEVLKQKKAEVEAEKQRKLEAMRKAEDADKKRQIEWEKMQRTMWVGRCQKYWIKGVSPCFCEKYMDEAPGGVKNTCKK